MPDQEALAGVLSQFARTLVRRYSVGDVLHELVEHVTALLAVTGVGVTLVENEKLRFAAALDEATARVEQLQEDGQQGPCLEAYRTGAPVLVADLHTEVERWPRWAAPALDLGIVSVAGIPMHLNGTRLGALDIYSTSRRDWSREDVAVAQLLADMATSYVVNASALEESRQTAAQLQQALDSRVVIEQAKGVIAAEKKVSVDDAFEVLRDHARRHNVPLREVAEAVVRLGLRP